MTSLSKLIKSTAYVPLSAVKQLEAALPRSVQAVSDGHPEGGRHNRHELDRLGQLMLERAREEADRLLQAAREEAARVLQQAKEEAEQWWEKRRGEDDAIREEIRQAAHAEGYEQGRQEAESQVLAQYEARIAESRTVLEHAHEAARRIVANSEPFLIELSCAIAGKIVGRKLEETPDWAVDMVKSALQRSTGKESILLCVAPSQFSYLQSVRDELEAVIDAQAELVIMPDHAIEDRGCVIKTAFGTVDARVETQLTEIKEALLEACLREEPHDQ